MASFVQWYHRQDGQPDMGYHGVHGLPRYIQGTPYRGTVAVQLECGTVVVQMVPWLFHNKRIVIVQAE